MKKILLIISIILLSSCSNIYNPRRTSYPFSLYFYLNDDEFKSISLSEDKLGIALLSSTHYKSATVELESGLDIDLIISNNNANNLDDLINTIRLEGNNSINFSYVKSIVFHKNIIKSDYFEKILSFCYFHLLLRPNIYLYSTHENYIDLYSVSASNGKSPYFNMLQSSFSNKDDQVFNEITINNFLNSYYDNNRCTYLLNIEVIENQEYIKDDFEIIYNTQYDINGAYYTTTNKKEKFIFIEKEHLSGLTFFNEFKDFYYLTSDDNQMIFIEKVKKNYSIKENKLTIDIKAKYLNSLFNNNENIIKNNIINKIYEKVYNTYRHCYLLGVDVYHIIDLHLRKSMEISNDFNLIVSLDLIYQNNNIVN